MTIVKHELRRGRVPFLIWTGAIAFMLAVCIFIYPEMKSEMDELGEMLSSMGSFTAAFGMDKLNFGTLIGYYSTECGSVLGLGGAFYAALCAAGILSKEEKDRTAEFLLAHPVSRARIMSEKLLSILIRIAAMNLFIYALAVGSVAAIGESVPWPEITLLHTAFFLLQTELAGICFGVSAFLSKGSAGAGIGIAAFLYFMNLIANITESAAFLKYVTPYAYCSGADIVNDGCLDGVKVAVGMAIGAAGIACAYWKYPRKDIR